MGTVRLHRVFRAPPERVFRAFTDPLALVKWMAPHGFVAQVHSMDLRVGGSYRMSFVNWATGSAHSFGGTYSEVTPHQRLRYSDRFDDPALSGSMQMTIDFRAVLCGTELTILQEGIPEQIPVEMCMLGWQESLDLLTLLVEAEIPDAPSA